MVRTCMTVSSMNAKTYRTPRAFRMSTIEGKRLSLVAKTRAIILWTVVTAPWEADGDRCLRRTGLWLRRRGRRVVTGRSGIATHPRSSLCDIPPPETCLPDQDHLGYLTRQPRSARTPRGKIVTAKVRFTRGIHGPIWVGQGPLTMHFPSLPPPPLSPWQLPRG